MSYKVEGGNKKKTGEQKAVSYKLEAVSEQQAISCKPSAISGVAGKYQPYPEYKESETSSLGVIPDHWSVQRVNHLFTFGRGLNITKANLEDSGVPCVSYGEVHSKYGFEVDPERHSLKYVNESYLNSNPRSLLSTGDFVFSDTSEDLDGAGNFTQFVGKGLLFAGYHTVILRSKLEHDPRYLAYAFDAVESRSQIRLAVKGVKVFSITQEILKNVSLVLPTYSEQRTIAAFLDYETARIDALIAKQQRLIELLKEKRQAVISHAVTKGLNPNVPMKDSGVEWLGQVPAHWDVSRIGWLCSVGNGMTPNRSNLDYWDGGDQPWLNSSKVNDREVVQADQFVTMKAVAECSLPRVSANSVIMAITGEGKTRGTSAIVRIEATINQHVAYMTPSNNRLYSEFLLAWLESQYGRIRFESEGWGSTKAAITCSDIKGYLLPLPPYAEQSEICGYLVTQHQRFDDLIEKSKTAIQLLQERRTALISAAVTGKIDVRGWQPPAEAEYAYS